MASYTTPDGSESSHSVNVATDYIAAQLVSGIIASSSATFNVTRDGSVIHVWRKDQGEFSISWSDGIADEGMQVVKGSIQTFSDLPAKAWHGFTVEIVGDQSSSFDNYYVKYDESGNSTGTWIETIGADEEYLLNAATMPHALIRQADGTFSFERIDWDERKVGDLESNPMPSFVGQKINDIFFHRNRLGFVAGENLIFSKAGSFFDFFITTATALLDEDPIDVAVSHTKVSILKHAVPFNETLLLFSDQTQFQLGVTDVLTPETISINQTTEYEADLTAKPVGAGRYVYFAINRGNYTGMREYYVDAETEVEEAQEITAHVPTYIPDGVFKIASSDNESALVCLSDQTPNQLFIYKYYWSGTEKLQSSWSRWVFAEEDNILYCDFIESNLYLLVEREDGTHLEVIPFAPNPAEDRWDIHVHLDSKVDETGVALNFTDPDPNTDADNITYVTLPYKVSDPDELTVVIGPDEFPAVNRWYYTMNYIVPANFLFPFGSRYLTAESRNAGMIFKDYTVDNTGEFTVLAMQGDWRETPFYIGKNYEFRYTFSTISVKEQADGGGQITVGSGRLQLRNLAVLYDDTGYFRAEVTPYRRETYTYTFSGRVVGSGENVIGDVSIEDGRFKFPVAGKNDQVTIELVNDSFLPSYFLNADWEGFYHLRSRRI